MISFYDFFIENTNDYYLYQHNNVYPNFVFS